MDLWWMPSIALVLRLLHYVIQIMITTYSVHTFHLLFIAVWTGQKTPKAPRVDERDLPPVTVQLPIFNERYTTARLIRMCAALDYPMDKLEIQVLDDSTEPETPEVVQQTIRELKSEGPCCEIVHIQRDNRIEYKAGALREATPRARGEFLALFDADFMPEPGFLRTVIPHFAADERIGCVQTRWGHANREDSVFTHVQALGHDGHFMIEQQGRYYGGLLFNFNGTGGVWRKKCCMDAGGWGGDTLAEDLDLSYRVQMAGWRFRYVRDVVVPAELPVSISAFKKQQHRWAKGSMQTAKLLVPKVWGEEGKNLTLMQKYNSTVHLMGYFCHPLMLANLLVTLALFFFSEDRTSMPQQQLAAVLIVATGPPLEVALSQVWLGHPERLVNMPMLLLLHHGLCVSNAIAVCEALLGHKSPFERTPKFGDATTDVKMWKATKYMQSVRKATGIFWEFLMLLVCIGTLVVGLMQPTPDLLIVPWLVFFALSFAYIIFLHIQEGAQG